MQNGPPGHTAHEAETGRMRTKSKRAEVTGGERGQGGSGSTSCFESDGSFLRAKHLLSVSPSVSMCSVHFSCPLHVSISLKPYGEKILSLSTLRAVGLVSCWSRRREGQNPPGFTQTPPAPASRNKELSPQPHNDWSSCSHSLGLNTLLFSSDLLIPQAQAQYPAPGGVSHQGGVRPRGRGEAGDPGKSRA